ncbi:MAG: sulfurtransferase, partial [Flavobacterium sp.]|nr:sulfurtransferase [Flavobacterium sp.]
EGLQSKFIGKNFVFDQRLGERITNDIISKCHQCGAPSDNHTNCHNDGCHLLFIQCDLCKEQMQNCCSVKCKEIILLPLVDQVNLRKGVEKNTMIFRKGISQKIEVLEHQIATSAKNNKEVKKSTFKKIRIGKGQHYFSKIKVGQFIVDNHSLLVGDNVLICGPTTGEQKFIITKMLVNDIDKNWAQQGDNISFELPFKIRNSDVLFKISE